MQSEDGSDLSELIGRRVAGSSSFSYMWPEGHEGVTVIESEVSAPSILWLSYGATSFPFSAFANAECQ